jgi:hypothetical protein
MRSSRTELPEFRTRYATYGAPRQRRDYDEDGVVLRGQHRTAQGGRMKPTILYPKTRTTRSLFKRVPIPEGNIELRRVAA